MRPSTTPRSAAGPDRPAGHADAGSPGTGAAVGAVLTASGRVWPLLIVAASVVALLLPANVGMARSAAWNAAPVPVDGVAVVLQSEIVSCGPALIASLSTWAGRPVGEDTVLGIADVGEDGITLAEFARLASLFNAPGAWYRVGIEELSRLPTPFVAHLDVAGGGHYVAVLGVRGAHAVVADPAVGALAGPTRRLLRGFSGRAFLLQAGS